MATGGIVDSRSPLRLSVDAAVRKGFGDEELAEKLRNQSTKSYFDPNTGTNLHYAQLMQRCWTDPNTGFLYLEVEAGSKAKAMAKASSSKTSKDQDQQSSSHISQQQKIQQQQHTEQKS